MRNTNSNNGTAFDPQKVWYTRATVDLATGAIHVEEVPCRNLEDVLGGFGRSFQMLMTRDVTDALSTDNPLIINTGLLTGSNVMTGLRTYFSAYSPLKHSDEGLPAAIWSAASGKFGSKMKWAGLDEIVVEGRASHPLLLVIQDSPDGPQMTLKPADALLGMETHDKIMTLQKDYEDAHFAVIGPAGEAYENCYFAAVALSTENELKSGDDKCRFAGRGGQGQPLAGVIACQDAARKSQPARDRSSFARPIRVVLVVRGRISRFLMNSTYFRKTTFALKVMARSIDYSAKILRTTSSSRLSRVIAAGSTATRISTKKRPTERVASSGRSLTTSH